ncbi:hypothetical protein [Bradyrhizobium sp. CCH5-F6]|uniref:hypothetical protein n=1 Tax=Bradyrhizobium sp. CCH5-F6 TaxID=1768753 RepID=UPI001FD88430|nr:hypothetical protein [Bradyrhizobium sp. CCH5-F6]
MLAIDISLYVRRSWTLKTEFDTRRTLEPVGAVFDRLFEVGFDRADGDAEQGGDLAVGHAIDAREHQHASAALRQLGDRVLEEIDLGSILDHARGIWPVVGNVEQGIDLAGGKTALLGATAVGGDVERDAEQIRLRAAHLAELAHSFQAKIGFVESF